jgi:hypothetical protein
MERADDRRGSVAGSLSCLLRTYIIDAWAFSMNEESKAFL